MLGYDIYKRIKMLTEVIEDAKFNTGEIKTSATRKIYNTWKVK